MKDEFTLNQIKLKYVKQMAVTSGAVRLSLLCWSKLVLVLLSSTKLGSL